jgi:hypothetical protein
MPTSFPFPFPVMTALSLLLRTLLVISAFSKAPSNSQNTHLVTETFSPNPVLNLSESGVRSSRLGSKMVAGCKSTLQAVAED